MMRILHINPTLQGGGIEAMICNLANEMSTQHTVTVCSIFEPKSNHIFISKLNENVHFHTLHKKNNGFEIKILWRIFNYIRKSNFDVIHIHCCFYYYVLPILFYHKKYKFVYTIHSDARKENIGWDQKIFRLKKFFFKKGWMRPVTISNASKKSFDDLYGMDSLRIYNGIQLQTPKFLDLSFYRVTPKTKILFHAGRISSEKNQLNLCRICQSLIEEGYDIVLLIAGQVQNQIIFNNLSKYWNSRIIYLGERKDIIDIMNASDAFCLPSIWEGLPVTLLESISVNCIPICTPVGGIPEIVLDGQSGFLSNSTSNDDFKESIINFLESDEEHLDVMKKKLASIFIHFEIKEIVSQYLRAYRDML